MIATAPTGARRQLSHNRPSMHTCWTEQIVTDGLTDQASRGPTCASLHGRLPTLDRRRKVTREAKLMVCST